MPRIESIELIPYMDKLTFSEHFHFNGFILYSALSSLWIDSVIALPNYILISIVSLLISLLHSVLEREHPGSRTETA